MQAHDSSSRPEMWAGLECSVVRVGDDWRNQAVETGHADRPEDLELLASLGIRTTRYPIIWETIAPEGPDAWRPKQTYG